MNGDGPLLPGVPTPGPAQHTRLHDSVEYGTPQSQLHINFLLDQQHLQQQQRRASSKTVNSIGSRFNQWLEPQVTRGGVLSLRGSGGLVPVAVAPWTARPGSLPQQPQSPTGSVTSITRLLPPLSNRKSAGASAGSSGGLGRRRVISVLAAVSLFEGALLIGLFVFTYFYMKSLERAGPVCESAACVRTAASLLRSIDPRVSPCEDFYAYACGSWPQDHPAPAAAFSHDWFYDRHEHVLVGVREYLEENTTASTPWAVSQARILYRACLDREAWDALGLDPLLAVLDAVGLPRRPPLGPDPDWTWERTSVLARKRTNKDLLVNLDVRADVKDRTVNKILVKKYRSGSPLLGHQARRLEHRRHRILARTSVPLASLRPTNEYDEDDGSGSDDAGGDEKVPSDIRHLAAYLLYMMDAMTLVTQHANGSLRAPEASSATSSNNSSRSSSSSSRGGVAPGGMGASCNLRAAAPPGLKKAALDVLAFNKALYRLAFPENRSAVRDDDPLEMWVWELQNLTDAGLKEGTPSQINWTEYLTLMFENVPNVTLDLTKDKIIVEDEEYLRNLSSLLAATPRETVKLSLWWEMVDLLAPYTTAEMRQLRRSYQEIASGTGAARPREMVCTESVNSLMGMAVSYGMADVAYLRTVGEKVHEMLGDVKSVFQEMVADLDWMDAPTKAATLDKVKAMKSFVGFPEWLLNVTLLDEYYEGINMTSDAFLDNMLQFQDAYSAWTLASLRRKNEEDTWATDPTDVNAFHSFQSNAVTIPAAILQFPFYDLGLEALNYGAIGTILGHELTHGFDSYGRLFDRDGNMRPWWSNATVAEYENRTACFVKQYGDYFLPEVEMNLVLVVVALAAAAPGRERRGLSLTIGHAPLVAHAPIVHAAPVLHAPVVHSAPLLAYHAPLAVHAPIAVAHAPYIGHSPLLLHR
ncbi:endothelin-converting enzyme 2 isoform X2 [Frankliniella occidentalis]|uniref:Endothelin-converting enzyme 2 isoform X2 n=1 Tax=Frankliniella occidentalis TaxID=133901 RepID=A0A9C6X1Q0_FRAOC|nr:endothelin-converting enzyme 2 isoform X2 [Frankliniella occidentalis]